MDGFCRRFVDYGEFVKGDLPFDARLPALDASPASLELELAGGESDGFCHFFNPFLFRRRRGTGASFANSPRQSLGDGAAQGGAKRRGFDAHVH